MTSNQRGDELVPKWQNQGSSRVGKSWHGDAIPLSRRQRSTGPGVRCSSGVHRETRENTVWHKKTSWVWVPTDRPDSFLITQGSTAANSVALLQTCRLRPRGSLYSTIQ